MVADFTYVPLTDGSFAYTAFVIDAFAGRIVGWECSRSKTDRFVRTAIRHAVNLREEEGNLLLGNIIQHSDAGSQGGFNRSSQHPDLGGVVCGYGRLEQEDRSCAHGGSSAVAGRSCVAASYAFTWPARALTGGATPVLAVDRDRVKHGGGIYRCRCVGAGGFTLVS